jgi:dienelactone hydrolase
MPLIDPQDDDALADFTRAPFTDGPFTRDVYRKGAGPAVIVIHEIPGITPRVAAFARRVVDAGLSAVMPDLVGTPGRAPSLSYLAKSMRRACIASEFSTFALRRTSPITTWLRALARKEHARAGGPGVGAVGMCFSGGFALAMMVDETTIAPVLSQPSLPFPLSAAHRRDVGLSDDDLACVKRRAAEGVSVLGLRFTGDPVMPAERFARLREELGDRFIGVEIDSSRTNPWGYPASAHSVLTEHLGDASRRPTHDAMEQVIAFFRERLLAPLAAVPA